MGRTPVYLQPEYHEPGRALETALWATRYGNADVVGSHRYCPAGLSGRRCKESGQDCSIHNYSLALDLDPFGAGNPHFRQRMVPGDPNFARCKITEKQVNAVEAIRFNSGALVWRWLGWVIGDTMHFQANAGPVDALSGVDWDTVIGAGGLPPDQEDEEMLERGDAGRAVADHQRAMVDDWNVNLGDWPPFGANYPAGADGKFGGGTEAAVKDMQSFFEVDVTGKIDGVTSSLMMQKRGGAPPTIELVMEKVSVVKSATLK